MDVLNFVKDDTGGLVDTEQADEEGDNRQGTADQPIVRLEGRDIVVLDALRSKVSGFGDGLCVCLAGRGFGGSVGHGGWVGDQDVIRSG